MTSSPRLFDDAAQVTARFRKIRDDLKGARVTIRKGKYAGRHGEIIKAATSPEALIEAVVKLDRPDRFHHMRPRIRVGITEFEVL